MQNQMLEMNLNISVISVNRLIFLADRLKSQLKNEIGEFVFHNMPIKNMRQGNV